MGKVRFRALAVALLAASVARAEAGTNIRITSCPEALTDSLPALVKLEIDVLLRERGAAQVPPEGITIRCNDDHAALEITMAGATRESNVDLGALAPEHRARAIALATAELVHSMSHREPPVEPPARSPAAQPSRRTPAPPPLPAAPRPTLSAGALAEWLGAPKTLLFGARLALRYPLGNVIVPAFSLDGSVGDSSSSSAKVRAETLAAAAHLYFGAASSNVRWEAGPGARFGWASLAGRPEPGSTLEGRTLTAAWGGPELRARAAYGKAESWSSALALELGAGLVVLPVHGRLDGSRSVFALEGVWLSASAQVGFVL